MNKKQISVKMSYLLRHNPEGLNIDKEGWVSINEMLNKLNIDIKLLEEIVREDSKSRYSFNIDKSKIRANQGHSITVDLKLKKQIPPVVLYHGTGPLNIDKIKKHGLCKMSRQYVHLSQDINTAKTVGKRHSKYKDPVILEINCSKMVKDKIDFYISENNVWLVDHVAPKYIVNFD